MRADKVRDLDSAELQSQLREMIEQIYRLRFQLLMGQSEGLKKYRGLRKDRARVLSVLRERELAAEAAKG
ncbi:MAG: 50S ribosomal protein L29 [Acidobacteriales bacterium]|nr:MAG: 50S ribosomal protein L29 [Terriglobales bacterium]